jgi:hypothetical protein
MDERERLVDLRGGEAAPQPRTGLAGALGPPDHASGWDADRERGLFGRPALGDQA